jgi:hypothetical protein
MEYRKARWGNRCVYYLVFAAFLVFLAGCGTGLGTKGTSGSVTALDTKDGLAAYLREEPAVRTVEPWENPYGEGLVITTRNYRIYTTHLEPLMLRQIPAFVESAFRAYQSQLSEPLKDAAPFIVYLFGTRDQWEAFTRDTAGADAEVFLKIQAGAYVANGVCVAYDIGRRQTFSILGHEGWHQFNQRLFVYRLPSWLDEGIATLFETCRYEQGRFMFNPASNLVRLGALKQTLQEGRLIPLDQLLLLNPGQVLTGYNGDPNGATVFYAQVYALVRFLREEQYGLRLRGYHAILRGAAHGDWPLEPMLLNVAADRRIALTVGWNMRVSRELFAHYFDEEMKTLNAEYMAYCRKITYPVRLQQL